MYDDGCRATIVAAVDLSAVELHYAAVVIAVQSKHDVAREIFRPSNSMISILATCPRRRGAARRGAADDDRRTTDSGPLLAATLRSAPGRDHSAATPAD